MIPDSITSIDDCVFARCTNLRSITIPDSVTHIGAENFIGCYSLNKISVSESFYDELVAFMPYLEAMRYPN